MGDISNSTIIWNRPINLIERQDCYNKSHKLQEYVIDNMKRECP